ncbi:methyltransferase domain-containing protein [Halospeciosus flavus]|uniref:Methyltransferase domain-containing protein n=1 Tax=Halospeciosus flavus TaxID=3032283 RepID=A0ABD5Z5K6_9EURY|nr:methyltransferase domain-containing protein [Halospeciosus flavus]
MRRFSAAYLSETRRGMWEDRDPLEDLSLADRERVLDVGCGTGELTRVLREEAGEETEIVGLDADTDLLAHVDAADHRVAGDATRLPFPDDYFDLVVCQALLINLPDPAAAVEEFARVSSDLVSAIEPDNSAVLVESTVEAESPLARRARDVYIEGVETDVTLGASAVDVFEEVGLDHVHSRRYEYTRSVEPPYSGAAVEAAQQKATGSRLDQQRQTLRKGGLSEVELDELRQQWREMGREVVEQMQAGEYARQSVTPFFVTVGHV